ncbi:hypothetical protein HDU76_007380 [Blyttiomyces sp. JEL0837]|nr:hypothetical protein HDU76_007380 [Blyttiomyces sp. JEL0837]
MTPPPFGIEESSFLTLPRLPATDDLYPIAMTTSNADAEKAQLALGTKYLFSPAQWLMFWRRADGASAKAGLRSVIQIGTIYACLTGKYKLPQGAEVKMNKAALRQAVVETKFYDMADFEYSSAVSSSTSLASKIRADMLSNSSLTSGPRVLVVDGDTLNVALQLRRIFKHTPCAVVSINPSVPGGFYRRGGSSPEEEVCRRSNLWDCLDDPYSHSEVERPEKPDLLKLERVDVNKSNQLLGRIERAESVKLSDSHSKINRRGSLKTPTAKSDKQDSSKYSAGSLGQLQPIRNNSKRNAGKNKRSWSYPVSETACIYAPGVQVFRSSEAEGYSFLKAPGKISFICMVPETVREYAENGEKRERGAKLVSRSHPVWKGMNGNKALEPRLNAKAAKAYAQKAEFILKIAIKEGRKIVILGAIGCGAHGTPPRHAAEIFKSALQRIDPKGENFDLVAFAIIEDCNSFKSHNPEGNISPFADVLSAGVVTPLIELENMPEIFEGDELDIKFGTRENKPKRGSYSEASSSKSSKETLNSSIANSKETISSNGSHGSIGPRVTFGGRVVLDYTAAPRKLGLISKSEVSLANKSNDTLEGDTWQYT